MWCRFANPPSFRCVSFVSPPLSDATRAPLRSVYSLVSGHAFCTRLVCAAGCVFRAFGHTTRVNSGLVISMRSPKTRRVDWCWAETYEPHFVFLFCFYVCAFSFSFLFLYYFSFAFAFSFSFSFLYSFSFSSLFYFFFNTPFAPTPSPASTLCLATASRCAASSRSTLSWAC